jgi:hypothetical protein
MQGENESELQSELSNCQGENLVCGLIRPFRKGVKKKSEP